MGQEEPKGLNDAYGTNLKMVVDQLARTIEDTMEFRKALDAQYLSDIAGIRMMEKKMLGDFHRSLERKEYKGEHRDEELEEQLSRSQNIENQQASGVQSQMGGINQVISEAVGGAIQELIASGKLKWS